MAVRYMHSRLMDGSCTMTDDRVYRIDGDNHISRVPDMISLDTDAEAIVLATGMTSIHAGTEVRNGTHLVCRVPVPPYER